MVESEILKNRPSRGGKQLSVEASDFVEKSALFLPQEAQFEFLVNLPHKLLQMMGSFLHLNHL